MRASEIVAIVIGLSACGPEKPAPEPPRILDLGIHPQHFVLANGVEAVLISDPNADFANVLVRYKVGAIDDADAPGAAHVAAHLIYSQRAGKRTLWDELDRIAFSINATPR